MMMMTHYMLDDSGNVVETDDLHKWVAWFETSGVKRQLKRDEIDGVTVSTVFLGINHNFVGGSPILWESMIFGGPLAGNGQRYYSREEALKGHDNLVSDVRRSKIRLLKDGA